MSIMAFVPSAAAVLADWGADVIKIEHPDHGDMMRGATLHGVPPDGWRDGFNLLWDSVNRGKRSVGLDLHQPDARHLLYELIDTADVFLTNLLPKGREKLGIDAETVRARNPRIIYGVGTAFGSRGPKSETRGYDVLSFWHSSGISHALTSPDAAAPVVMPGPGFGDLTSGMNLAGGIAAALYRRERSGEGQVVEVSLFGSGLWSAQANTVGADLLGLEALPRVRREDHKNPLALPYRTSDGRFVALSMMEGDRYWPGLCRVAARSDLLDDPRLATARLREENSEYCVEVLAEVFATRSLREWQDALAGQDGPWASIQSPGDLLEDPQVAANHYIRDVDYGHGRVARLVTSPVRFGQAPVELRPAPQVGAHTEEVLLELGRSWDEIMQLKEDAVIR
jgi:crotonobetainyl-CoA:carnitine CoA-transferase CaiB-like acyl-CoA transferase